jgi:hypothetical protein
VLFFILNETGLMECSRLCRWKRLKVVVVYAILLYSSAVLQQFNEHGSAMPVPSTTVFKSFDFDRDFKGVKVSTVS